MENQNKYRQSDIVGAIIFLKLSQLNILTKVQYIGRSKTV